MVTKKFILFFSILWLSIVGTQAQITFEAIPQKTVVTYQEPVKIQYRLSIIPSNKEVGRMDIPAYTNAQIIERKASSNIFIENGNSTMEYVEEITLLPIKVGKLNIESATVPVAGKKYKTKSFHIKVKEQTEDQADDHKEQENHLLILKVSTLSPYVNEGTVVQLKFYTKQFEFLNSLTHLSPPNFKGCFVQPIKEKNNSYQQETINGEAYFSRVVASYVVFSSQPGNITLDPFTLTLALSNNFFEEYEINIKSNPVHLFVKSLPTGAPKNFYGLVGQFTMKATTDKVKLNTHQVANLKVSVAGTGNLSLVKIPSVGVPEAIEEYKPVIKQQFTPTLQGLKGTLEASYVLVPQEGGNYQLKVEPFSYFDPVERRYKTITPDPIELKISSESKRVNKKYKDSLVVEDKPEKKMEFLDYSQNSQSKPEENSVVVNKSNFLYGALFVVVLLGLFLFFILRKKKNSKKKVLNEDPIDKEDKNPKTKIVEKTKGKKNLEPALFKLKKIATRGEDKNSFYTRMEEILLEVVNAKIDQADQYSSLLDLEEKVTQIYGEELADEWKELLLKSQIERYSNLTDQDSLLEIYDRVEELIQKMT